MDTQHKKTVLALVAHPDDEVLGCGATLAAAAKQGHVVYVIYLADGESSRKTIDLEQQIERRKQAAIRACTIIGAQDPIFLDLPDNRLDSVPLLDIVQRVEMAIGAIQPEIVFTHHHSDLNIDHRIAHQVALTVFRPQPNCSVKRMYGFEVPSSTEWSVGSADAYFRPQHFVDVSATFDIKMAALEVYVQEMYAFPHARSNEVVKALAELRGASVGVYAAEAFSVIREVTQVV